MVGTMSPQTMDMTHAEKRTRIKARAITPRQLRPISSQDFEDFMIYLLRKVNV